METDFNELNKKLDKELTAVNELIKIANNKDKKNSEKKMLENQMISLQNFILKTNTEILSKVQTINLTKPMNYELKKPELQKEELTIKKQTFTPQKASKFSIEGKDYGLDELDLNTIKRLKKREKKEVIVKERKPNKYVSIANKYFSSTSSKLLEKGSFDDLRRNLVKSSMPFLAKSYVSLMLLSTMIAIIVGFIIMIFFLFFNLSSLAPFISFSTESFFTRLIKVIWIPLVAPIATFLLVYIYPSLEKSSMESKINHELPFATIHMSAISGSSIEPSKIFEIIIATKEYPNLEKEFSKVMNEMHIFGKDLVSALRTASFNSPSKKLTDLFNGVATTITSGGDLSEFFDKRSSSLLFDYRLEREKETKSAETFMDIYISVVIAAPMILMLLLIMMKISGIGISLSTGMITFIMILAVTVINIGFLTLLQMKQQK